MRVIAAFLFALAAAQGAQALETARQLVQSGAPRLALNRIEQLQPRDLKDPRWAEWETLRLGLLYTLGRDKEVLARAAALPSAMPERELREALKLAARAAIAAGQGAPARAYAARMLWQLGASHEDASALRLLVIESHLADRNGDAAFRAMLRFTQDYQPLERATAARFVEALLELDMGREAANWLSGLEEGSAAKQMLLLKANLLAPDAAIAQARARLAKGAGRGHWQVIAEAAVRRNNLSLRLEALEQLLQLADRGARAAALAAQLWQAYLAGAHDTANQNQLLTGDDAAWSDFASRRLGADSFLSRAFFAHLVQRGQVPATRNNAQLQLVFSLQQGKLDLAALRLFEDARVEVAMLDAQARYLLGAIAEARNEPALSARFWEGLGAPPNTAADDWQMRLALAHWRAGNADAAVSALRRAVGDGKPLSSEAMRRGIVLAQEMLAAGKPELADAALEAMLPLAETAYKRDVLFALGRIAEASARFALAADYYLRSALLVEPRAPDAAALQARLAAALNLARAGYKEDARAQFEWLLRNSRDAAQLEVARRELAKL